MPPSPVIDAPSDRRVNSLTSDNGKEFAQHLKITRALKCAYYFCDPYSSWQRGSNEQVNGLVRRYYPKKTGFDLVSDAEIEMLELRLNDRPRKALGYAAPGDIVAGRLSMS